MDKQQPQEVSLLRHDLIYWMSIVFQVPGAAAALRGGYFTADEDRAG